jgi:tRNA dimethylallyltransferase
MVASGLVAEAAGLLARPRGLSRTARQALGYREVLAHLEEGLPLESASSEARRRTKAFARRQRVWWRRDPRISWYGAADNPLAVIPALLGDWRRP